MVPKHERAKIKSELAKDGIELRKYNDIYSDLKKVSKDDVVLVDKATANFLIVHSLPNADNVRAVQSPVVLPKAIKTVAERENEKKAHVKDGMAILLFKSKAGGSQLSANPYISYKCS